MDQRTDAQLVSEYLSGDEAAFESLVGRYLRRVYSFSARLTGNAQDAEEIAQETFLKVWRNLKKYRSDSSFKTWLFAIARNTAIDRLRKKDPLLFADLTGGDEDVSPEEIFPDTSFTPAELAAQKDNKRQIAEVLERLPPAQREVLLLHYTEDMTFHEIGRVLGAPLHTVKSRHHRAIIALREILTHQKERFGRSN